MKKYPFAAIVSGVMLVTTVTGCAQSQPRDNASRHVGMANPASVYCLSQKGQLDNETTAEGVRGYCTLPSGERIDEWALFRRDHPQK